MDISVPKQSIYLLLNTNYMFEEKKLSFVEVCSSALLTHVTLLIHNSLASPPRNFQKLFESSRYFAQFDNSTLRGRQGKGNLGFTSIVNLQDGNGCCKEAGGRLHHQARSCNSSCRHQLLAFTAQELQQLYE
jgi:hypothetical protein